MKDHYSFEDVCNYMKEHCGVSEEEIGKEADPILGLLISGIAACYPYAISTTAISLIGLKNELVKSSRFLIGKITKAASKDETYIQRQQRAEYAFTLICYTSFAEAYEAFVKKELVPAGLTLEDNDSSLSQAIAILNAIKYDMQDIDSHNLSKVNFASTISLPHPTELLNKDILEPLELFLNLTEFLSVLVKRSKSLGNLTDSEKKQLEKKWEKLPGQASKIFHSQYVELAKQFDEFHFWSQFHEHKRTREALKAVDGNIFSSLDVLDSVEKKLDVGFAELGESIQNIPLLIETATNNKALQRMTEKYQERINAPIFKDEVKLDKDDISLSYPKRCEIFIPQNFRVIRATSSGMKLEDKALWKDLTIHKNLSSFIIRYFAFSHSVHSPILVLGHPGSGKSMFTEILAAKLSSTVFKPIRVVLRDLKKVNQSIRDQIEEQIEKDSDMVVKWLDFREAIGDTPPLIILDGFDELLQTTGRAFANYLREVQAFQQEEYRAGRPVRFMITSRITLIGKAELPDDCTVVRLSRFDPDQQKQWVKEWNRCNKKNATNKFKNFSPPYKRNSWSKKEIKKHENINDLMEQPLLLTMLAIYDAITGNEITNNHGDINRTILYDSLLRYFVDRQRRKDLLYRNMGKDGQTAVVDKDIERLGVTALGMLNRGRLSIQCDTLNGDLKYFGLIDDKIENDGSHLTSADNLLGSFFFVHEDKAGKEKNAKEMAAPTSYEFLHKTFGEFLAAQWIFSQAYEKFLDFKYMYDNPRQKIQIPTILQDQNWPGKNWFAGIMHTPFHHEPVVMQMLYDWCQHYLEKEGVDDSEFFTHIDTILQSQFSCLLNGQHFPSFMNDNSTIYGQQPLHGYLAIYSMNLVILRTVLDKREYLFDEKLIDENIIDKEKMLATRSTESEGEKTDSINRDRSYPWDRLTNLWRSWYSFDGLNGLTNILKAKRHADCVIHIEALRPFDDSSPRNRLDLVRRVAISLGDDLLHGLAGQTYINHFHHTVKEQQSSDSRLLAKEGIWLKWNENLKEAEEIIYNQQLDLESLDRLWGILIDFQDNFLITKEQCHPQVGKNIIRLIPSFPYSRDIVQMVKILLDVVLEEEKNLEGSWFFLEIMSALNVIATNSLYANHIENSFNYEEYSLLFDLIECKPKYAIIYYNFVKLLGLREPSWFKRVILNINPKEFLELVEFFPDQTAELLSFIGKIPGKAEQIWIKEISKGIDPVVFINSFIGNPLKALKVLNLLNYNIAILEDIYLFNFREFDSYRISRSIGQNLENLVVFFDFAKNNVGTKSSWIRAVIQQIAPGEIVALLEDFSKQRDVIALINLFQQFDDGFLVRFFEAIKLQNNVGMLLNILTLKKLVSLQKIAEEAGETGIADNVKDYINEATLLIR
ncbi:MAG: AAA family ATPase [Magnetococcales bacterium]|nr:AAA family ATPase [Magnetococcales bacterium]